MRGRRPARQDRVLVDATSVPPTRGGVARYVAGLLSGLGDLGVEVDVVVKRRDLEWLRDQAPSHRYHVAPSAVDRRPVRLVWEQVALPLTARRLRADVLHSPHYTSPLLFRGRRVVTLHDATFLTDPDDHGRLKRLFFSAWIRWARARADVVVVPSRSTAVDLDASVPPSRAEVLVAHLGVDSGVFRPPSAVDVARFREVHGLAADASWIAFLGTVEPRKNLGVLLDAHDDLRAKQSDVPPLLVSGGAGWDSSAVARLEAAGDVSGAPVRWLGYLPLEQLHVLLGASAAVVYPTSREGFGLPVLEAMSSGALVVTTPVSAIPEVADDAVLYASPTSAELSAVLSDVLAGRVDRASLTARAVSRAASFTWAECASVHVTAYGLGPHGTESRSE